MHISIINLGNTNINMNLTCLVCDTFFEYYLQLLVVTRVLDTHNIVFLSRYFNSIKIFSKKLTKKHK